MSKVIKTPLAEEADYASKNLPELTTFVATVNGEQVVVEAATVEEAIEKVEEKTK
jgi:hypothetical protein